MPLNRPIPKTNPTTASKFLYNNGTTLVWASAPAFSIYTFSEYIVVNAGAQAITLPVNVQGVFDVQLLDPNGGVLPLYHKDMTISGGNTIVISQNAGLKIGDKINGKAYVGSVSSTDGSSQTLNVHPPTGYTGLVAPITLNGFYASVFTGVAPPQEYIDVGNLSFFNGRYRARYGEYLPAGTTYQLVPVHCKRVDIFVPMRADYTTNEYELRKLSDNSIVDFGTVTQTGELRQAGGGIGSIPELILYAPTYEPHYVIVRKIVTVGGIYTVFDNFSFS